MSAKRDFAFSTLTPYDYTGTDEISDFAYVVNDSALLNDLLMVGGTNLSILLKVVPYEPYFFIA